MPSLERPAIINTVIGVSPYDLGKAIGGWPSGDQALVLRGLSDGLERLGTADAWAQVEYLIQELDGRADYLLGMLAEYAPAPSDSEKRYAPVIPEDAWEKARGITPGEPIMDELTLIQQDAPVPDGDPSQWWPHGDQVPPFDHRPEAHRFEGQESAVDLLRSARGWGRDGSAEEAGK